MVVVASCWHKVESSRADTGGRHGYGNSCSRQDQGGWWQHKVEGASTMVRPAKAVAISVKGDRWIKRTPGREEEENTE